MQIKHVEIDIPEDEPFVNCKLDRAKYAKVLTSILGGYPKGFALAINNPWGAGKTTFVKMWQQQLKNEGYRTIYFNAWENDFSDDPLIAIMAELQELTGKGNNTRFKSMLQKGADLSKHILPALAKAAISKYVNSEELKDILSESAKGASDILAEELKDYARKKKAVGDFRKELSEFIKEQESEKPLVFILDELDRCRPDYAVRVLEHMKHFFSVEGIVYVLSIDKKELGNSVRGFYGSEHIDSNEYLRRFIDLEYIIPRPANNVYCKYLFNYFDLRAFIYSDERKQYQRFRDDDELILKMAVKVFDRSGASLRQQEKVFGLTSLILRSFQSNQYIFAHILVFLIYLKVLQPDIYYKIQSKQYEYQEICDLFYHLLPKDPDDFNGLNFEYMQALLLHLYGNSKSENSRSGPLQVLEGRKFTNVVSKYEVEEGSPELVRFLSSLADDYNIHRTKIDFLTTKIDLTEPINL